ncbi:MAG: hypothetical protein ACPGQS_04305 [Bradymonadia bacterium]
MSILNELDVDLFDFVQGQTPCVIVKSNNAIETLISSDELSQMACDEHQLMSIIETRTQEWLN